MILAATGERRLDEASKQWPIPVTTAFPHLYVRMFHVAAD